VLIPKKMTDSVCFVCRYRNGEYEPVGTGFFVGMPIGNPESNNFLALVVTALHVITDIEGAGQTPNKIYLRVNTKDGGVEHVHIPSEQWARPDIAEQLDNGIVDAAVCWFPGNNSTTSKYDYLLMPASNEIANRDLLEEEGIGIGNEVFFAGLFIRHTETKRNEPIVRAGMIAAMPEKIETRYGPQHAFLIETRSIGGFSGSPVFVNAGFWRFDEEGQLKLRSKFRMHYLIGVISGHWEVGEEIQTVGGATERASMNMGIAKVTPMEKVLPLMAECVKKFQAHGAGLILKDLATIGRNFGELIKSIIEVAAAQPDRSASPGGPTGQTTSPAENPSTEIGSSDQ
jgi:hypothetical protein